MEKLTFLPCDWEEISRLVEAYIKSNRIVIDSFWENHVLASNHYKMMCGDKIAGFFAIDEEETLVLFHVFAPHAGRSEELFAAVKKYEKVTNAMVATGDEFFLSHCIDSFMRIEKLSYFGTYTDEKIPQERQRPVSLRLAGRDEDFRIREIDDDYFAGAVEKKKNGLDYLDIYVIECEGETIGLGLIEYGRVLKEIASLSLYTYEPYRRKGTAISSLQHLKDIVHGKGCRAVSGCWHYHHASKKCMANAGAYAKTRLLRFYF